MKDSRVWPAVLALLLCLLEGGVAAMPAGLRGGKMETITVPEGYRPLPVTDFVVDVEKHDTYTVTVGIEYLGKPSDAQEWLEKNFIGKIEIYRIKDNELTSTYFVFNKKNNHPNAGASGVILGKTFWGEQFSIKLDKGNYIILPRLYSVDDDSQYMPYVYVSFKRIKSIWW